MAIGPSDAQRLNPHEISQADRLEGEIDAFLREDKGRRGRDTTFSSNETVSDAVFHELVRRYNGAGWRHVNGGITSAGFTLRFLNPPGDLD